MTIVQQLLDIPRDRARQLGEETVRILKRGEYLSNGGMKIDLRKPILHAVESTVTYSPDKPLTITAKGPHPLTVIIQNTTTLAAARSLIAAGYQPAALNMASATSPGGGFLEGAWSQEEYLSRLKKSVF